MREPSCCPVTICLTDAPTDSRTTGEVSTSKKESFRLGKPISYTHCFRCYCVKTNDKTTEDVKRHPIFAILKRVCHDLKLLIV